MNTLPGFHPIEQSNYGSLHEHLWPASPVPSQSHEPQKLTALIEGFTNNAFEKPMQMRFIDLDQHPLLRIRTLEHSRRFLIRGEYTVFMTHILRAQSDQRRSTLSPRRGTGHRQAESSPLGFALMHRTGKCLGACYFLFWLLASGQSVFSLPETDSVYYFSSSGVRELDNEKIAREHLTVVGAVRKSWILIDVDIDPNPGSQDWYPREWLTRGTALVWTSRQTIGYTRSQSRPTRMSGTCALGHWPRSTQTLRCVSSFDIGSSEAHAPSNKINSTRRTSKKFKPGSGSVGQLLEACSSIEPESRLKNSMELYARLSRATSSARSLPQGRAVVGSSSSSRRKPGTMMKCFALSFISFHFGLCHHSHRGTFN